MKNETQCDQGLAKEVYVGRAELSNIVGHIKNTKIQNVNKKEQKPFITHFNRQQRILGKRSLKNQCQNYCLHLQICRLLYLKYTLFVAVFLFTK